MINIGKYIETAINWLTENFAPLFDAINVGIGGFIDGFQNILMWIPFYVTIALLAILAWYKSGKGVSIFTILGLLLIWGMGFWNETMQTLALVLSSTIIALIMGLPLGIWSANSKRCDKILHPILDLMQTMPAFVYLIPAVLFFGLGTVPGAFATIIFAMPPVVRLTSLGIKQVPKNVVEASRSFGATPMQLLFKVQLPLALPTIMTGINQTTRPDSMQRLSNFLLIFLCFSVPKALFVIVILFMKLLYIISGKKLYGGYVAGGLALASLIYVIYGATEGKQHFQIREVTISSDELPSGFDGYRIVQISDIHSGSWTGNGAALQKAVNLINAQHADLVLFTGDLVNNVATELDEFIPILEQIKGKDGVYSVLGNHDYSPYIKWETEEAQEANLNSLNSKQAAMGWKILNNDHVILHHHGDSIALAGVENSGNPPFPNYGDLQKALKGTEGMYKILMSHDPTHWHREVLPESDVQLMLSGHTHEMQFSLFGFSPAKFVYPEHNGLYQEGKQSLFVNIGLGYLMFPMRLGAWPEITVITLHKI